MKRQEIASELRDLNYNIGVMERTKITMSNYDDVLAGYRKILRDQTAIVAAVFDLVLSLLPPEKDD